MNRWNLPPHVEADPILGLAKVAKKDTRTHKMDLLAGVLREPAGILFLKSVASAQIQVLQAQRNKGYLPIEGSEGFVKELANLLWPALLEGVAGMQTIGGTGALHLAAGALRGMGCEIINLPTPSWPNHPRIFKHMGFQVSSYQYLDENGKVDCSWIEALKDRARQAWLVHGCCHNPSGLDLSPSQWQSLFELAGQRGHIIVIDMAYHGLKESIEKDAFPLQLAMQSKAQIFATYSCAKNFTLYAERVGALFFKLYDDEAQQRCSQYLTHLARASYSNPPLHGAAIVEWVLKNQSLRQAWLQELENARQALKLKRAELTLCFEQHELFNIASRISQQSGLFGYFNLSPAACQRLREEEAIYLPDEGRVNLSAIHSAQMPRLVQALAKAGAR